MTQKQVTKREDVKPAKADETISAQAAVPEPIYVPYVDICEDTNRIRLLADMPGVDQAAVSVTVDNGVLTIEGKAHTEAPAGYELAGQEFGVGRFRRDFTLSDGVDVEGIKARVSHGVLEVTLPKREHVKMRKIAIAN